MEESEKDVLSRLDVLVEAAMVDDHNFLIDVLEKYDEFMKIRDTDAKFTVKKEEMELKMGELSKKKDCRVDLKRLPKAVLERYLQKQKEELARKKEEEGKWQEKN